MTASWIANIFLVLIFVPQFKGQGVFNENYVEENMRISERNAEKIEDQFVSLTGEDQSNEQEMVFNPNYVHHYGGRRYQKQMFKPNYDPHQNTLTGGGQRYRRRKVFKPNYNYHQNILTGGGQRYQKRKVFDHYQDTLTGGGHSNQNKMEFKQNYGPHNEYSDVQEKPLTWRKKGKNYFINFNFNGNENRRKSLNKNLRFQPYKESNPYKDYSR